METTFFDLPLDLREIVYRHVRFLEARQRIAELLGPKRLQRGVLKKTNGHSFWNWSVEAKLFVSPTKFMLVRQSYYKSDNSKTPSHLFNTVEIVDDAGIHVVIDVFREKVKLILETRRFAGEVLVVAPEEPVDMHLPVLDYSL